MSPLSTFHSVLGPLDVNSRPPFTAVHPSPATFLTLSYHSPNMPLTLMGLFALGNGHKESISTGPSKTTSYIVYDSTLRAMDDTGCAIQIRHFSLDPPVPNDTVALIVAKAAFPAGVDSIPLLLTLQFFVLPGDITSDEYDENLPDFRHPVLFGIGHVASLAAVGESPCHFTLNMSSYISGTSIAFPVRCVATSLHQICVRRLSCSTPPDAFSKI